ncbi:beta-lactamase/transpeptidase-like protein [Ilyonectria robusta]|uniref:beta-lactamase/transpeptidase-like protein n=1 Tax=Ilyonectria robusta TaxID=1079257 RepID=UPI001E8D922F|nr:beta-lactamase/transpeptidase-like protein [Ilyonectria robusta]KAH8665353.1 beta-lactamase/transpeptidase-like protein [Ilyonectria robusta]
MHISSPLLVLLTLARSALSQTTPTCPLLGPVFPPVRKNLGDSRAIKDAVVQLTGLMDEVVEAGTNTTFYVQAFSGTDKLFHYKYVPESTKKSLTSGSLNENTVFRIGSVSKLLTVYTLLAEVGIKRLNDPVTQWVPELAKAVKHRRDPVQGTQWDEVTIGQLGSHMSGIGRNFGFGDFSVQLKDLGLSPESFGLPSLKKQDTPACDAAFGKRACTRKEFFKGITSKIALPVTSTSNTPIYSNMAYQILAYALEAMTNKTFEESFNSALLGPLGLNNTTLEAPKDDSNAVIPGNKTISWWDRTMADASPYGGMFSTPSDLTAIAQSILSSSILPDHVTRAWLKPVSHTAELQASVGMPWEIRRLLLPISPKSNQTRVVDLYTKNGMLGSYSSMLALSPDHDFGFVISLAGDIAGADLLSLVPSLITQTMIPALEEASRETAKARFAGKYENSHGKIVVGVDDTLSGLVVQNWTRGAVDMLQTFRDVFNMGYAGLRLYPAGIENNGTIRFRGVYENRAVEPVSTDLDPWTDLCMSWGGVDAVKYGDIGIDDFEFKLDNSGHATGITPRVWRETLDKVKK